MNAGVKLTVVLTVSCFAAVLHAEEHLTALQIAERVAQADADNDSSIQSFTVIHKYTLDNLRFKKHAEMSVRVSYKADHGKDIQMISGQNIDGMQKHIFQKVIEAEKESSRPDSFEANRVSPRNYSFTLLGTEKKDGYDCYVLAIQPRRKSRFLIEGKIWVNKSDFGIVRMEGHPKERVSFWVGRPEIVQTFCKVGNVWIQAATHSAADVKIAGRSEFLIESFDYKVQYVDHDQIALATAPGSKFRRISE
jgi:hypothetical protein